LLKKIFDSNISTYPVFTVPMEMALNVTQQSANMGANFGAKDHDLRGLYLKENESVEWIVR
jgi:hypothetical protein